MGSGKGASRTVRGRVGGSSRNPLNREVLSGIERINKYRKDKERETKIAEKRASYNGLQPGCTF